MYAGLSRHGKTYTMQGTTGQQSHSTTKDAEELQDQATSLVAKLHERHNSGAMQPIVVGEMP